MCGTCGEWAVIMETRQTKFFQRRCAGYGKPVPTGVSTTPHLKVALKPGEGWELATTSRELVAHLASDTAGKVISSKGGKEAIEISNPKASSGCTAGEVSGPLAFGPDNRQYLGSKDHDDGLSIGGVSQVQNMPVQGRCPGISGRLQERAYLRLEHRD